MRCYTAAESYNSDNQVNELSLVLVIRIERYLLSLSVSHQ